jgi:hypothetical protein
MANSANQTRRQLAQEISGDLGLFNDQLVKDLRNATPKRTGHAAASWQATASVSPDKYNSVVSTNTVPYIERLNQGHSKQAPAGFVEITIEKTLGKFNK